VRNMNLVFCVLIFRKRVEQYLRVGSGVGLGVGIGVGLDVGRGVGSGVGLGVGRTVGAIQKEGRDQIDRKAQQKKIEQWLLL
jgi:hypothetical protein